ncbi:MAG TPA: polysaccharide biosynthesis/export family protein [Terriglobales bacterium]|nr:polysaccharide biosynthesis/export family protein [Terriglobales bacterium]
MSHSSTLALTLTLSLSLAAAAAAQAPAPAPSSVTSVPRLDAEYKVGPDDLLDIEVWHEPDISGKVPVRPDGKISVPLAGEIVAAGQTAPELQAAIATRLRPYLSDPAVTVVVDQVNSRKVNVLGQVLHPGTYALGTDTHVLDALATAGGPAPFAHLSRIYVLRRLPSGRVLRFPFDYKQVIAGGNPGQNALLQPGDTIVVP